MGRSFWFTLVVVCAAGCSPQPATAQVSTAPFVTLSAAGDSFTMGDGLLGPNVDQSISYDFDLSRFPVTNSEFACFIADGGYADRAFWTTNGWKWKAGIAQPAFWKDAKFNRPDQPVVGVSWYEAAAYCNWLSMKEGRDPAYDLTGRMNVSASGYRLPTEVEWEYAAAKGGPDQAERIYPWGDAWDVRNLVCRVAPAQASTIAPVGSRSPQGDTPQGLADMSGNVWEWCSDNAQADSEIAAAPSTDRYAFRSDSTTAHFVLRGGSWWNNFQNGFRSAFRNFTAMPGSRFSVIGFRIVRR